MFTASAEEGHTMDWPVELLEGDLTAVVQAVVDLLTWVLFGQLAVLLLALALLPQRSAVIRRFWCALRARDVEVAFAKSDRPLLGAPLTVRCCRAFDPRAAITCDRRGVKTEYRLPAPPPLLGIAGS
jgi:hypothetical protein